jgi:hypothetical protein
MTAAELAAVCERHGIRLLFVPSRNARCIEASADGKGGRVNRFGSDAFEAVCALLKARHGITTKKLPPTKHHGAVWDARAMVNHTPCNRMDATEIAAVVGLAGLIKGAA